MRFFFSATVTTSRNCVGVQDDRNEYFGHVSLKRRRKHPVKRYYASVDVCRSRESKRAKVMRSSAEKFATIFKRLRRQSGNERRTISPIRESPGKFRRLVTRTREDERRRRVFVFRERGEKVPGKFAPFRPLSPAGGSVLPPRLRRIDSSKGNSYPLTGRNSLRGEILNHAQHTQRGGPSTSSRRGVVRYLAASPGPKLMSVPRNNLSADPVYYGTRLPFADEWLSIFWRRSFTISSRALVPYLFRLPIREELTFQNIINDSSSALP
ncbi:hypothetical protein ACS0PU_009963 [Formica fusca]